MICFPTITPTLSPSPLHQNNFEWEEGALSMIGAGTTSSARRRRYSRLSGCSRKGSGRQKEGGSDIIFPPNKKPAHIVPKHCPSRNDAIQFAATFVGVETGRPENCAGISDHLPTELLLTMASQNNDP